MFDQNFDPDFDTKRCQLLIRILTHVWIQSGVNVFKPAAAAYAPTACKGRGEPGPNLDPKRGQLLIRISTLAWIQNGINF